jgi:hypothetical protein
MSVERSEELFQEINMTRTSSRKEEVYSTKRLMKTQWKNENKSVPVAIFNNTCHRKSSSSGFSF